MGLIAEKDDFWDSFIIVLSGIHKQDSIFIGNDGYVGRDTDIYGSAHGGMEFGTRNPKGERMIEYSDYSEYGGMQHIFQERRLI